MVEFDHFKTNAGLHTFILSAKEWIETTGAIGIYACKFVRKGINIICFKIQFTRVADEFFKDTEKTK